MDMSTLCARRRVFGERSRCAVVLVIYGKMLFVIINNYRFASRLMNAINLCEIENHLPTQMDSNSLSPETILVSWQQLAPAHNCHVPFGN